MLYKVIHNNMLVDLLSDVQWIRYLPRQKRVVMTDRQSANGVMGNIYAHALGQYQKKLSYTIHDSLKEASVC